MSATTAPVITVLSPSLTALAGVFEYESYVWPVVEEYNLSAMQLHIFSINTRVCVGCGESAHAAEALSDEYRAYAMHDMDEFEAVNSACLSQG